MEKYNTDVSNPPYRRAKVNLSGNPNGPQPPSGITGLVEKNRFATQRDTIKIIFWGASPTADVTSYLVYRNGTLIDQVNAGSPLTYADHNRSHHKDTYSVVAIDPSGNSTAVSITF